MSKRLGAFNRAGKIADGTPEDAELADVTPFAELHDRTDIDGLPTEEAEAVDETLADEETLFEPAEETSSNEAAPAAEEAEQVDADGDGHDDETGQFVDGNQEAADPGAEDEVEQA